MAGSLIDVISDFGLTGLNQLTDVDYTEFDSSDPNIIAILRKIEEAIRAIYNKYGRQFKEAIDSVAPRKFTGDFSRAFSARVYPQKRRSVNLNISLSFGYNMSKSNYYENYPYYYRIMNGDDEPKFAPATDRLISWALQKGLIYEDDDDYRWVEYSKRTGQRIQGKKFQGMQTYFPGIGDTVRSEIEYLQIQQEDEIVTTINTILSMAGMI